jgi:hypothetical protein
VEHICCLLKWPWSAPKNGMGYIGPHQAQVACHGMLQDLIDFGSVLDLPASEVEETSVMNVDDGSTETLTLTLLPMSLNDVHLT